MNDTDKILKVLAEMRGDIKSLQEGQEVLQEGQKTLQTTVEQQGKAIADLQEGQKTMREGDIKSLHEGQKTLELKVEAVNASVIRLRDESKQEHKEIIQVLSTVEEIDIKDHEKRFDHLERRVEQLEKHPNLQPIK